MNFLYPAFLLGALAIAVPIVLHLLRRDVAPELPFSAVRLLRKSPVERSRRRRIRDLILLAARVAALLLLAAAFARPFAPTASSAMLPLRIVAIDRSFSMGAPGQFERAVERARAAIDDAGFQERVALIAFDERAEVLAPPGAAADARRALDGVSVGHAGTRYSTVFTKAADLASGGPARLILVSDMQRTGWEGEARSRIPESLEVELIDAGTPAANLAVVDARMRDAAVLVTLRNASSESRAGTITLQPESGAPVQAPYTLAASVTAEVAIPWTGAGPLTVSIEDPEGFPADDRRYLVGGATAAATILVITSSGSPGYYVERALAAAQNDEPAPLGARLVSPAEIAGGRAADIPRYRALVLLATRTLDRAAREAIVQFVRKGGGLFVAATADVEPDILASMFGWTSAQFAARRDTRPATFTVTDVRHPVFRPFGPLVANLGGVRFSETWRIDSDGWQLPARFDDGAPALLERSEGQGRVVLFASDLDRRWNDFPVHPAFVPFVVETLRHVASGTGEPSAYLVGRAPAAIGNDPGIRRVDGGRAVAVNVDGRESGTAIITPDQFREMLQPVAQRALDPVAVEAQTEARQSLWMYGLILMLGVLVAESFVGRA